MNTGCKGSNIRSRAAQAPPKPSETSAKGPKQHAVAPNAASRPPTREPLPDPDPESADAMHSRLHPVVGYRVKSSRGKAVDGRRYVDDRSGCTRLWRAPRNHSLLPDAWNRSPAATACRRVSTPLTGRPRASALHHAGATIGLRLGRSKKPAATGGWAKLPRNAAARGKETRRHRAAADRP